MEVRSGGGRWDHFVHFDSYVLLAHELPKLVEHARLFNNLHPSIEMACQRLLDSVGRSEARDSIVDSVIGLESILLINVGEEKYRGETRYRFALNYASMSASAEDKYEAFRFARDLYDARSAIVHGKNHGAWTEIRLGKEKMPLHQGAKKASSALRSTIKHFLNEKGRPAFLAEDYWIRCNFGFSPADSSGVIE